MNEDLLKKISLIIKDYRAEELGSALDKQHVKKWIDQFDEKNREIILKETAHILQNWYFDEKQFESFFDEVLSFLCKKYSISEIELIRKTVFLSTQEQCKSQTRMLNKLKKIIIDRYGITIISTVDASYQIFVYLDDGLFTGAKARREISSIMTYLPAGASIYAFYMIGATTGLKYSMEELKKEADKHSLSFDMFRMNELQNARRERNEYENGNKTINISSTHSCLWPLEEVDEINCISEYISTSVEPHENKEKYLFRQSYWKEDKGIFTSTKNRSIVEKEFLIKGIELAKYSNNKGLYPLGFNAWPSLGFGSFCATYMNISNTCPLVLWWGNIEEKGDVLDMWYPLLPRRIDSDWGYEIFKEPIEVKKIYYCKENHYNMCPDCGNYFGIMDDGGNGFCVDCAWKH